MERRWSKGSPSKLNTNIIDIYIFQNVVLIIVLKFIIMFSYFIYIVLKLKNKYSFFFFFFFICNPLCRRTIRQYVEQVLRLSVLVFPPPFDFVHIYTVKSYPHTLSIKILLYTDKILQFGRLLLKVNYMNRI